MEFSVGRDPQAPTAVLDLAAERAGQAEDNPEVPVLVELGAEAVLVVVAVDLPAVVDDFEDVGRAVAVGVLEPRDVAPLGDVEPAVFLRQAERLLCRPWAKRLNWLAFTSLARGSEIIQISPRRVETRHPSVRHELECACFQDGPSGSLEAGDGVVVPLRSVLRVSRLRKPGRRDRRRDTTTALPARTSGAFGNP